MDSSESWPGHDRPDGSVARATLLHALSRNPRLGWTAVGLASWYGLRIHLVREVLEELRTRGLARRFRRHGADLVIWVGPRARRRAFGGRRRERSAPPPKRVPSASLAVLPRDGATARSGEAPAGLRPAAAGASP